MQRNFWVLFLVFFSLCAQAYETDQYTTPPSPLADVGEDLSRFIHAQIQSGIEEINQDVVKLPGKLRALEAERDQLLQPFSNPSPQNIPEDVRPTLEYLENKIRPMKERLVLLQSEAGLVKALHQKFGGKITWQEQRDGVFGLPLTIWNYPDGIKEGKPIAYRAGKLEIVYSFAGFHRIISPTYFVFSSTIKAFGVHFGIDKIGHIFNQGFQYHEISSKNIASGMDEDQSMKSAVNWGVGSENGVFGQIVDGVYSNADLAANFAGFLFYQNLFREVRFGSYLLPSKLIRQANGTVIWNPEANVKAGDLIQPFITQHLDESLNPSVLEKLQRGIVRKAIQSRCQIWKDFYQLEDQEKIRAVTDPLKTFYGLGYGHKSENTLKIEEICWP